MACDGGRYAEQWAGSKGSLLTLRPLRTVLARHRAHGSSKPLRMHRLGWLAKCLYGYVYETTASYLTFPIDSPSSQCCLDGSPDPRQQSFDLSITLSAQLWIPVAFRLTALAYRVFPFPLEN